MSYCIDLYKRSSSIYFNDGYKESTIGTGLPGDFLPFRTELEAHQYANRLNIPETHYYRVRKVRSA